VDEETTDTVLETTSQAPAQLNVAGAMPTIVSDDVTDDLKVLLGEFEGPLDLLLHLIKKEDLNIYDIPIAPILEQYVAYLEMMKELNIDGAGEFILMAAELSHLKSRLLLYQDKGEEEDQGPDPRDACEFRAAIRGGLWSGSNVPAGGMERRVAP
jgi:hypothetical protein